MSKPFSNTSITMDVPLVWHVKDTSGKTLHGSRWRLLVSRDGRVGFNGVTVNSTCNIVHFPKTLQKDANLDQIMTCTEDGYVCSRCTDYISTTSIEIILPELCDNLITCGCSHLATCIERIPWWHWNKKAKSQTATTGLIHIHKHVTKFCNDTSFRTTWPTQSLYVPHAQVILFTVASIL
jgi:hypothetical protein